VTLTAIERDGFALFPGILDDTAIRKLIAAVTDANISRSERGRVVYGARNILEVEEIAGLATSTEIRSIVEAIIGPNCRAVRGIFFDKTPGANWPVAWHQDLTLAVAERNDIPGWINWSVKAGVHHVQPPVEFLERMVTLRMQLDDCGPGNGPLRVLPGTHRLGRLSAVKFRELRSNIAEESCIMPAGSVLAMKPLILHASSAAKIPNHRRVIHLEYAPRDLLPPELRWIE
jgi:ectoine hydroxylase-related dioxygenase (phytanoyl-CoA dioxygenase family)